MPDWYGEPMKDGKHHEQLRQAQQKTNLINYKEWIAIEGELRDFPIGEQAVGSFSMEFAGW